MCYDSAITCVSATRCIIVVRTRVDRQAPRLRSCPLAEIVWNSSRAGLIILSYLSDARQQVVISRQLWYVNGTCNQCFSNGTVTDSYCLSITDSLFLPPLIYLSLILIKYRVGTKYISNKYINIYYGILNLLGNIPRVTLHTIFLVFVPMFS